MAGLPLQKLSELEHAMVALAEAQLRTETNLDRLEANLDRHAADNDKRFADLAASVDRANREFGEATRRSGRLVEDLVGPSVVDFFRQTFGYDGHVSTGIRLNLPSLTSPNEWREFDVFAASPGTFLLVSVKSTVRPENIAELIEDVARVRDFFPRAQGSKVFGAMASLYIGPSVVTAGERRGLYMLGLHTGLLTTLNSEAFQPRAF